VNYSTFRVPLEIGSYFGKIDFSLLPLDGYDIILGQPWLRKHQALIDCKRNLVTIDYHGRRITFQPNATPECNATRQRHQRGEETLINASQLSRLIKQGHSVFAAFVKAPDDPIASDSIAAISKDDSTPDDPAAKLRIEFWKNLPTSFPMSYPMGFHLPEILITRLTWSPANHPPFDPSTAFLTRS
jgi:hypothetical protein